MNKMNTISTKILIGDGIMPSFTVNDQAGKLLPNIKHCFIEKMLIDIAKPPATIRAQNGTLYQAVYDNVIVPDDSKGIIQAIVSFQKHYTGEAYAVIRTLRIMAKEQIVKIVENQE